MENNRNIIESPHVQQPFLTQFFLDPDVIFSSHTKLINASTKDFTPIHLVTFSIWRSRIRMKFYRVYSLIRL